MNSRMQLSSIQTIYFKHSPTLFVFRSSYFRFRFGLSRSHMCTHISIRAYPPLSFPHTTFVFFANPPDMTPCDCRRGCCLLNAFVHFTAVLINAQQTGDGCGIGIGTANRDRQVWGLDWMDKHGIPACGCCVKCQNLFANQSQTYTRTLWPVAVQSVQSQCGCLFPGETVAHLDTKCLISLFCMFKFGIRAVCVYNLIDLPEKLLIQRVPMASNIPYTCHCKHSALGWNLIKKFLPQMATKQTKIQRKQKHKHTDTHTRTHTHRHTLLQG